LRLRRGGHEEARENKYQLNRLAHRRSGFIVRVIGYPSR
jgi:hypothetical protein